MQGMDVMNAAVNELISKGKVHRRVYADPEIFKQEQQLLFGRTWLYVGHESQLKSSGDFISADIAGQPIMLVRTESGGIRAFFNRCPHRGALMTRKPCGHAKQLQCAYHGWSFDLDGKLKSIPLMSGYDNSEVLADPDAFGLTPLPRLEPYRGFLFGSLAADGPDLKSFLGPVALNLDNMIERSPSGKIEVWGSPFRMIKRNNWKIYLENLHDGAHALPTHISSIRAAQKVIDQSKSEWTRLQAYIIAANSQSPTDMANVVVNCYPNGHSDMMAFRKTKPDTPEQREYEDALAQRVGRQGVEDILGVDRNNAIIYPNLSVQPNWQQLRLIVPLTVDTTRVDVWTFRLVGAPDWINRRIHSFSNTIHTPASLVRADDLENFERVQLGLAAATVPWTSAHREIAQEPEPQGKSSAMSERYIRNQYDAWSQYMREQQR